MQRCCIYKLKDGKSISCMENLLGKYVILEDFGNNPFEDDTSYCVYKHINIKTMEYTSMALGYYILPSDVFEKYFELHIETTEINEKLRELGIR